jgi:hypothetical protein
MARQVIMSDMRKNYENYSFVPGSRIPVKYRQPGTNEN